MNKKLIIIGGDLASGKSTYSQKIADLFDITAINKDTLKEMLGDRFIATNREENLQLSKGAFDFILYMLKVSKTSLIIESNFKESEMVELSKVTEELGYEVLSLKFRGDDAVLQKRFLDRLKGDRHYVHRSQDFSNLKDFSEMLIGLRKVEYIGKVINVDSTTFDYATDESLLNEIKCFLLDNER